MALRNFTGESAVNTAKTHDLTIPEGSNFAKFFSLTISSRGGDISEDTKIAITDSGRERWIFYMRSGGTGRAHFTKLGKIILANTPTSLQITTAAAGADVIIVVSAVYGEF